jgi:hypothetical protein
VSDEYREIEVVEVGSGPPKPAGPARNRTDVLLSLLVVGVFVGAGCSAFTAWTVYGQAQDTRDLNCAYLTFSGEGGDDRDYDDLEDYEKGIADAMDCDIEGR